MEGSDLRLGRRARARVRVAYHEAGHAVLSAAIHETPRHMSVRADGHTLGRSRLRPHAPPSTIALIALAGYAAEHLLTGRRPRSLDREVGFAILAHFDPELRAAFGKSESLDGTLALRATLAAGCRETPGELRKQMNRLYDVAREALATVWSAVSVIATALLKRQELEHDDFDTLLAGVDLFGPVYEVQRRHGLLRAVRADVASARGSGAVPIECPT